MCIHGAGPLRGVWSCNIPKKVCCLHTALDDLAHRSSFESTRTLPTNCTNGLLYFRLPQDLLCKVLVDPALRIAQDVHDQGFPFLKGFYCAKRLETRSSRRPQE